MEHNIILLFGGPSEEHNVAVASAQHIVTALPRNTRLWFWSKSGNIFEATQNELLAHKNPFTVDFVTQSPPMFASITQALDSEDALGKIFCLSVHGIGSEDGTLQRELESRSLAFTGSDAQSSAAAFDKIHSKALLKAADPNVHLAKHRTVGFPYDKNLGERLKSYLTELGPLVLKPNRHGSTFGVIFVHSEKDIEPAVNYLTKQNCEYLAEELIVGEELTVGVVERQGGDPIALPCTEIVCEHGRVFDYEGKYLGAGTKEITPARQSKEITEKVQALGLLAHKVLGCYGQSRTDVIVKNSEVYFLEINTLPGMTKVSLVPQQLAAAKIPFTTFIKEQLALAKKR